MPLTIAGNGDRVLRFAARLADTVALSGAAEGSRPGRLRLLRYGELTHRVRHVQRHAEGRRTPPELNLLIHAVALSGSRREAAAALRRFDVTSSEEELADVPTVLVGPPGQLVEDLERIRAELGIRYITVPEPAMEDFAEAISNSAANPAAGRST